MIVSRNLARHLMDLQCFFSIGKDRVGRWGMQGGGDVGGGAIGTELRSVGNANLASAVGLGEVPDSNGCGADSISSLENQVKKISL